MYKNVQESRKLKKKIKYIVSTLSECVILNINNNNNNDAKENENVS